MLKNHNTIFINSNTILPNALTTQCKIGKDSSIMANLVAVGNELKCCCWHFVKEFRKKATRLRFFMYICF
jgi:hypothetical protein